MDSRTPATLVRLFPGDCPSAFLDNDS